CQLACGRPGRDAHFPDSLEQALRLDPAAWVFSDGWVDELLCPPGDTATLASWSDQQELIPAAKILVAIEPSRVELQPAWRRIIERPHGLPMLTLPEGDLDAQVEEILAAIAAAGNLPGVGI
ncbi:MAG: hypothetical protein QGH11_01440, partial [Pirellulaceae bacterium]|nr:hypothetical protein [Pirellulaceae bacterium]